MARRVYSDETKAAVMAALLAGQAVSVVAQEYNIPEGTVHSWNARLSEDKREVMQGLASKKKERVGELIIDYLVANLQALTAQARLFADEKWLRGQSAENAAVLHGVMTDKAVRLIEALGHRDDEQEATDAAP